MAPITTQNPPAAPNAWDDSLGTPAATAPNIPVPPPSVPATPPQVGSAPQGVPTPVAPKRPNIVQRVGNKVASGVENLGAAANPQYDVNDTGTMIAKLPTRSLFRGIVSSALAALAGAGAGAAATANPNTRNSPAQSFGVGLSGGFANAEMKDQAAREKAREDFEQEQKAILQRADVAHMNASTKALYFGMAKDARQPLYDQNTATVTALEGTDVPVQTMTASEASALQKQTPNFFVTHIALPIGMEPVLGPDGAVVSDKDGNPLTQERMAIVTLPVDPKTHNIVLPASVATDAQRYANISGISNAQNLKGGDEISLDSYIRLLTANQKARATEIKGWQTAQSDPQKFLAISGTGPSASVVLRNPMMSGPDAYRPWDGPVPADLQASLDLKRAETEHDQAETEKAKRTTAKTDQNQVLKDAKAKVTGSKEALADAKEAAKESAVSKYGSRATAAIEKAVTTDQKVIAAQQAYDGALAAQNKLLGISPAPATVAPNPLTTPAAPKTAPISNTVRMQLPNGQTGTIPASQAQAFLQAHPGSKQIQ
jgi:hypothetical protein